MTFVAMLTKTQNSPDDIPKRNRPDRGPRKYQPWNVLYIVLDLIAVLH